MTEFRLSDPETWVDQHGDYLYRFALMRLGQSETAEELVQETFLAALKGRDSFKGKSAERTWLTGILKNKIFDHYRKAGREKPASDQMDDSALDELFGKWGHWTNPPNAWASDPSKSLEKKEFWQVFMECLSGLPARLSQVFLLREMDDTPSEKVCKVLNLTSTNLWVMLHRARMRLRTCLETRWFNPKGNK